MRMPYSQWHPLNLYLINNVEDIVVCLEKCLILTMSSIVSKVEIFKSLVFDTTIKNKIENLMDLDQETKLLRVLL